MNFEELQNSWKSQPVKPGPATPVAQHGLLQRAHRQQRIVLWSNVATTIGFIGTFCVFAWLYISLHQQCSSLFGGSILFMSLLMLVYLWVIWKGFAFRRIDTNVPISYFLTAYTNKLRWRRQVITTYTWIYIVLLWLALMLYMIDVTAGTSLLFRLGAPAATTIYMVAVLIITHHTRGKKNLKKIDDLLEEIQLMKEQIEM